MMTTRPQPRTRRERKADAWQKRFVQPAQMSQIWPRKTEDRWAALVSDSMGNLTPATPRVDVLAFSGYKIRDLLRLLPFLVPFLVVYEHVFLLIGTNDVSQRRRFSSPEKFFTAMWADFTVLVRRLLAIRPGQKLHVMSILPRPKDQDETDPLILTFNDRMKHWIFDEQNGLRDRVSYVPTHCYFRSDPGWKPDGTLFRKDGLHPTAMEQAKPSGEYGCQLIMESVTTHLHNETRRGGERPPPHHQRGISPRRISPGMERLYAFAEACETSCPFRHLQDQLVDNPQWRMTLPARGTRQGSRQPWTVDAAELERLGVINVKGADDPFSNFYDRPIPVTGSWFPTVEHPYQMVRAMTTLRFTIATMMFCTQQASKVKQLTKFLPTRTTKWLRMRLQLLYNLMLLKFRYWTDLAQMLTRTYPRVLVHCVGDDFWGLRYNARRQIWEGQNIFGLMLMTIRAQLLATTRPMDLDFHFLGNFEPAWFRRGRLPDSTVTLEMLNRHFSEWSWLHYHLAQQGRGEQIPTLQDFLEYAGQPPTLDVSRHYLCRIPFAEWWTVSGAGDVPSMGFLMPALPPTGGRWIKPGVLDWQVPPEGKWLSEGWLTLASTTEADLETSPLSTSYSSMPELEPIDFIARAEELTTMVKETGSLPMGLTNLEQAMATWQPTEEEYALPDLEPEDEDDPGWDGQVSRLADMEALVEDLCGDGEEEKTTQPDDTTYRARMTEPDNRFPELVARIAAHAERVVQQETDAGPTTVIPNTECHLAAVATRQETATSRSSPAPARDVPTGTKRTLRSAVEAQERRSAKRVRPAWTPPVQPSRPYQPEDWEADCEQGPVEPLVLGRPLSEVLADRPLDYHQRMEARRHRLTKPYPHSVGPVPDDGWRDYHRMLAACRSPPRTSDSSESSEGEP